MTETMKDMVLLVTGAASGIGRAVAREAVAQGVRRLFVTDRNQAGLAALARDLDAGVQVEQGVADLANPAAPSRAEPSNTFLAVFRPSTEMLFSTR